MASQRAWHIHTESRVVQSMRGWFLGDVAGSIRGHTMGSSNPRRRIWTTVGFLESHQRVLRQVGIWLDSCFEKSVHLLKRWVAEEEAGLGPQSSSKGTDYRRDRGGQILKR